MFESMSPLTARHQVAKFRQDLNAEPKHPAPETNAPAAEPGTKTSLFARLLGLLAGTGEGVAKHEGHAEFVGR